jgi:hypothetical protein
MNDADRALQELAAKTQAARLMKRVNVEQVLGGVTAGWLAQAFGMDPKDVKRKLAGCPALTEGNETGRGYQGRTYELKAAAAYLIKPKISAANFLRAVKKAELPATLQQSFWDAMLKRQKYEENAGDLWRTDAVRKVLGETFQGMKFTMQLWVDTVERSTGLTADQRTLLTQLVDSLQAEIYASLVTQMQTKGTGPQLAELPSLLEESAMEDEDEDEKTPEFVEDEIAALI